MNRSIFQSWQPTNRLEPKIKTLNINFGPQHPASHGVLRLMLQLNGEVVEKADAHIGLLHRGTEKLIESKTFLQALPYFDRFDYVSMLSQEHAFCLAIESALNTVNINTFVSIIRCLYDELTRILNHMLAVSCHALDVGSMSTLFWAFEERERIMEFYERVSGARMHAAFYRPNECNLEGISTSLLIDIAQFTNTCLTTINEMHNVLTYNKIWKQRLVGIGVYSYKNCITNGLSGVMSRGAGLKRDLRLNKLDSYSCYNTLHFRSYTGAHSDCYDRFLLRMCEMVESINIINQVLAKLLQYQNAQILIHKQIYSDFKYNNINLPTIDALRYNNSYSKNITMEGIISEFKYWSEGINIRENITCSYIESPKGEFGLTLVTNGGAKPHRLKIKSPAYQNMQFCQKLVRNSFISDLVTLIGTIDIVFGEIDR